MVRERFLDGTMDVFLIFKESNILQFFMATMLTFIPTKVDSFLLLHNLLYIFISRLFGNWQKAGFEQHTEPLPSGEVTVRYINEYWLRWARQGCTPIIIPLVKVLNGKLKKS